MTYNTLISKIAEIKGITVQEASMLCHGKSEKQLQTEIKAMEEKLQSGLSNSKPKDINFKNFVSSNANIPTVANVWGNPAAKISENDADATFGFTKTTQLPVYTEAQTTAMNFLTGSLNSAEETFNEREKEAGIASDMVNLWKEIADKGLAKSTVKKEILSTGDDIKMLEKAATGDITRLNSVTGKFEKISFAEVFEKQRGVKFDETAIADCEDKANTFAQVKQMTSMVKEVKSRLKSVTRGTMDNQLSPEKATAQLVNAMKLCGVTTLKDMNKVLNSISEEQKNNPDVQKYGDDFRISKNKNGKYCIYRTAKNGFPAEATSEGMRVISDEITLRLNKVLASAINSEFPPTVSNETLEVVIGEKYDQYKTEYETAFAKAYGKKDIKDLSERYAEAQQKGADNIEMGFNILSTAAMLIPGAQVTAANWALKGAVAAKNTAALGKFAKTVSLVDKAKTAVKGAQTIAKVTSKLSPVIMANMIARPTYLVEQLTSANGMSAQEWEQWGAGVLQNSAYMMTGMGVGKLAEQAGALYKTKKLVDAFKASGREAGEITALIKANPVKFPRDIVRNFSKINNTAKTLQISTEVAADLASTYGINKALGNGDLQTQDWVNSFLFAINGSVIQKQFAPLSKDGKADFIVNAFKDYGMTKDDAFNVLKTMDDISAGKIRVKKYKPSENPITVENAPKDFAFQRTDLIDQIKGRHDAERLIMKEQSHPEVQLQVGENLDALIAHIEKNGNLPNKKLHDVKHYSGYMMEDGTYFSSNFTNTKGKLLYIADSNGNGKYLYGTNKQNIQKIDQITEHMQSMINYSNNNLYYRNIQARIKETGKPASEVIKDLIAERKKNLTPLVIETPKISKMEEIQAQKLREIEAQNKTSKDYDLSVNNIEDDGIYGFAADGAAAREDMRTRILMKDNLADNQFSTKQQKDFVIKENTDNEIFNTINKPLVNKNGETVILFDNIAPIFENSIRGKTPLGGNVKNVNFRMKKLNQAGVKSVVDFRAPKECSDKIKESIANNGIKYVNIPIEDMNWSPSQIAYIPEFVKVMNEGKSYVGCANGEARTDLAMAINYIFNPKKNEMPPFYFGTGSSARVSISSNINLLLNSIDETTIKELGWNNNEQFRTVTLKRFSRVIESLDENPGRGLLNNINKNSKHTNEVHKQTKPEETTYTDNNKPAQEIKVYNSTVQNKADCNVVSPEFNGCHGIAVVSGSEVFFTHFPPVMPDRMDKSLIEGLAKMADSQDAKIYFVTPVDSKGTIPAEFVGYTDKIKEKFANTSIEYITYPERSKGKTYQFELKVDENGEIHTSLDAVSRSTKEKIADENVVRITENNENTKINKEQAEVETSPKANNSLPEEIGGGAQVAPKSLSSKDFTHPELLDNIDNPEKLKEILINLTKENQNPIGSLSFDYGIKPVLNKDNIQALDIMLSYRKDLSPYDMEKMLKNINSDTNMQHFQKILECKIGDEFAFNKWVLPEILSNDLSEAKIKSMDLLAKYSEIPNRQAKYTKLSLDDVLESTNEYNIEVLELLLKKHNGKGKLTFENFGESQEISNSIDIDNDFCNLLREIKTEEDKNFAIKLINDENYIKASYAGDVTTDMLQKMLKVYKTNPYAAEKIIEIPDYTKKMYELGPLAECTKENAELFFEINNKLNEKSPLSFVNAKIVKGLTPELRTFLKDLAFKLIDSDTGHYLDKLENIKDVLLENPERIEFIQMLLNKTNDKITSNDIEGLENIFRLKTVSENTLESLRPVLEDKTNPIRIPDIYSLLEYGFDKPIDPKITDFIKKVRELKFKNVDNIDLSNIIQNLLSVEIGVMSQDKMLKFFDEILAGKTALKGKHSTFRILSQLNPHDYETLSIISKIKDEDGKFKYNEHDIKRTFDAKDYQDDRLDADPGTSEILRNNVEKLVNLKNSDGTEMIQLSDLKYICGKNDLLNDLINNLPPKKTLGANDFYERTFNELTEKFQEFDCKNFAEFEEKVPSFTGAQRAKAGKLLGEIKKSAISTFTENLPPEIISAITGPTGTFTAKDFDSVIKTINENPYLRKSLKNFNKTGKLDLSFINTIDSAESGFAASLIIKGATKISALKAYNNLIKEGSIKLKPEEFQKTYESANKFTEIVFEKTKESIERFIEANPERKQEILEELEEVGLDELTPQGHRSSMILIDFIGEGNTSGIIHNESIAKIESYTAIINIIKSVPKDNPEIPEKVSQVCKLPGVKDNDLKKFLNISKGLIDIKNYELLNKLLDKAIKNKKPDINEMTRELYNVIVKESGLDENTINTVKQEEIDKWDLEYLPYVMSAMKTLKYGHEADAKILQELVQTTIKGNYNEYLFNPETPNGKLNIESRDIYKSNGLDFDQFMGFKGEQQFVFSPREIDTAPILKSTIEDLGIMSKKPAIQAALNNFLSTSKVKYDGLKLSDSSGNDLSKKDLLEFISKMNKFLSENKKLLESNGILDIADHFIQRKRALGKQSTDTSPQNMTISLWKRDPHHDLFQGHYCQCCVSLDGANNHAMVESLGHTVDQIAELKNSKGETVGKVKLLFIKDTETNEPVLLANGFEIISDYQFDNGIREKFTDFMKDYSKAVTGKETPIYTGVTFQKINYDDLAEVKGNFQLLGKTPNNTYHLDSYPGSHPDNLDKPHDLTLKVMYKP